MSDAPLFENTDEQESAYAPEELPRGTSGKARASSDDGGRGGGANTGDATIPVAAGQVTGGTGGVGVGSVGTAGGGANPAIGAAAINAATDEDDQTRDRRG